MKIDLHVHSRNGSDGKWPLEQIFAEAKRRKISLISITDHDSLQGQDEAKLLAATHGIKYLTGVELNVTLAHPYFTGGKDASLDLLGYDFDIHNVALMTKLHDLRTYRIERAEKILANINEQFIREGREPLTQEDMYAIEARVEGSLGRPHIANHLIAKGIVATKQEAFDRYLTRCDVPKMPLTWEEASALVRASGGKLVLAHPNDSKGTSLAVITRSLEEQKKMILDVMLPFIDGIECWHTRHDKHAAAFYLAIVRSKGLIATGGSDCHQQPVLMGNVQVPDCVADQFGI
jgi:predicted metal-dependent phosphoesterase TrpH